MKPTIAKRALVAVPLLGVLGMVGSVEPVAAATRPSVLAHAQPSCAMVPTSLIKKDLGLTVGKAQSTSLGGQVHCDYTIGSNPLGVQISFFPETYPVYQQVEKAYTKSGAKTLSGIGQSSFAPSVHSTGTSNSDVYFYVKGYDVSIGAAVALTKVETLAKLIASKL